MTEFGKREIVYADIAGPSFLVRLLEEEKGVSLKSNELHEHPCIASYSRFRSDAALYHFLVLAFR